MSASPTPYARQKAFAVSLAFLAWALLNLPFVLDWKKSWPLMVFYGALILNSYFSIRTFTTITPPGHKGQWFLDAFLVLCLGLMPLNFNFPLNFVVLNTALFIIATLKYIFLLPLTGFSRLLYRKIRIDTLGILLCFLALIGVLWGYGRFTYAVWAIIFVLTNVYVLYLEPLYSLEHHYETLQ